MKKTSLILFLALAVSLISCNDDDGPSIAYQYAKITGHNLPAFIEYSETYDLKATFELPDACHKFVDFNGQFYEMEDAEDTLVVDIVALTSYDPNVTECNEEGSLTQTKSILQNDFNLSKVTSNEDRYKSVRFRFVNGINSATNKYEFLTVDVPVGEPEATPEEPAE
ncbi:MAG: hypothetical protein CMP12_15065 [Zunongwangia sp.]|jgi:hypothetical protein|uniref:hypothetical protein n=1 Tax=Zunongwangia TaxID=417127 RepID=UPI000C88F98E|nr:hypothetical protein [Zunongwangia profunda]MAG86558.1 hypothetical protein [Flavobacteriaceae bacterium]MAO37193.1 hypothetical protein [Zunongwangia sp.]MCC4230452.1 hypothetical protein [Zunongwangia profunda]